MAFIFPREQCLTCSSVPECPTCDSDEQCALTTQTCLKCPTTYCVKISSLSGSNTNTNLTSSQIAAISTTLSVVFFFMLILWLYFVWKRRAKAKGFHQPVIIDHDTELDTLNDGVDGSSPSRNSHAISNFINVAYIPGVTARAVAQQPPTISSRHSIQNSSYSKDTFFSDLENASFHGGKVASKATRPALVNMDDYNYDPDEDNYSDDEDLHARNPFPFALQGATQIPVIEEEQDESEDEVTQHMRKAPRKLTRYGSLRNKLQPPLSSSESSSGDSDSDEEHIELINKKHREGTLDVDSLNYPSSKGSTLKTTTTTVT